MKEIRNLVHNILNPESGSLIGNSKEYWERRYANGGSSGEGSRGELAEFKAHTINSFVKSRNIRSVIEFGCGDGNQLSLAEYPSYIGLDVSKTAIKICQVRFKNDKTKSFFLYDPDCFIDRSAVFKADLALSIDVIYHLLESRIFELHLTHLFAAARAFVIIYSSNSDRKPQAHWVKHRQFSRLIEEKQQEWKLLKKIPNKYPSRSSADFYIYCKNDLE